MSVSGMNIGGINVESGEVAGLKRVTVLTTARLHMGFFDLNGGLGRRFGSIGVSLNQPATHLTINRANDFSATGEDSVRALKIARQLYQALNLPDALHIAVHEAIPAHSGLGSGTQMALAVGSAVNALHGLDLSIEDIAQITSRGARSGIGLGTFGTGGVVVDGGCGIDTVVPPVIAHVDFPEAWCVLLILDNDVQGVHGQAEIEAFKSLPEFPAESAAQLCRHVLMQALPALVEQDLASFGHAIRQLQVMTGDHFAPAQGGRYASPKVASVLHWLEGEGVLCLGQSSWGPTGFAIFADDDQAADCNKMLQLKYADELRFLICKGNNKGGHVRISPV